jgi:hypothetical protein
VNSHIITAGIVDEPNFLNLFMKKLTRERVRTPARDEAKTDGRQSRCFPEWLDEQILSLAGQRILAGHIMRIYPDAPPGKVFSYAGALLANPRFRFARGVVRADPYYNWRCAHRGSNRPDLIDDMFHVLNATYCDVYVSKEKNQLEYAGLLLSRATRVEIYGGSPVDTWLEKLATNCVTETVPA